MFAAPGDRTLLVDAGAEPAKHLTEDLRMSLDGNIATYRRWLDEGWSRGNVDIADELYSADYVSHSLGPDLPPTRDGLKTFVRVMRTGLPDLQVVVEEVIAEGDRVAGRLTFGGTHSGTLLGIPATGKRADIGVMLIARFDADGRWAEDWVSWDQVGLLQQLGAIPAPAAGARRLRHGVPRLHA